MSPEQEMSLSRKLDEIHSALVGPFGQEEEGLLYRVRDHNRRIGSLERWRWYIVGGGTVIAFVLKLLAGH